MPAYMAQVLSLRRTEKDLLFLASHQPSKVVGGQSGFLNFLGNLGNTFFCQVYTPSGNCMACQAGGWSSCFQVFSSVSITTTMPYPVDNSTEPALHFPGIPIYSTPFTGSTKGFVRHFGRRWTSLVSSAARNLDEPGMELSCRSSLLKQLWTLSRSVPLGTYSEVSSTISSLLPAEKRQKE